MNYRVEIMIDENIEKVVNLYTNLERMKEWEVGLKRIEHTQGFLFDTNSQGIFHFEFSGNQMPMKVMIEKNDLPNQIIQIFEVKGAWNRCDSYFTQEGTQTKWVMDVTFRFDQPINLTQERFIDKTKASMNLFKTFVEKENTR